MVQTGGDRGNHLMTLLVGPVTLVMVNPQINVWHVSIADSGLTQMVTENV